MQKPGFHFAVLLLLLAPLPALAASRGIESSVGGTILDTLPRPIQSNSTQIQYLKAGEIRMRSTQYCGDGDVASFASIYPQIDFVPPRGVSSGTVSAVLGYWSTVPSAQGSVPRSKGRQAIWIPLATLSNQQTGAGKSIDTASMNLIGASSPSDIMTTVDAAVKGLQDNQAEAFLMPVLSKDKLLGETRNVYFAGQVCKTLIAPSSDKKNFPLGYEVAAAFYKEVWDEIKNKTKAGFKPEDVQFVALAGNDPRKISFKDSGAADENLSTDPLFILAHKIAGAAAPDAVDADLKSLRDSFYAAKTCGEVLPLKGKYLGYAWEALPMQLTCKMLAGDGPEVPLYVLIDNYSGGDPAQAEGFQANRDALVTRLIRAAMIQQAQQAYTALWDANRPADRCFDEGQPYINKVLASLPINVATTAAQSNYRMVHPEPNFALGLSAPYTLMSSNAQGDRSGDYRTVFMMSTIPFQPLELTVGRSPAALNLKAKTHLLDFSIRGVMCSGGVFFCQNP